MRFTSIITVASIFVTFASAEAAPEPSSNPSSVLKELVSYVKVLATDSAVLSAVAAITDPAALSSVESWGKSVSSVIANTQTLSSDYLQALPTEIRSVYSSIVAAEISIASKGGISVPVPGATGTGTGNAAAPTAVGVGAMAGAAAGVLGVLAVL